MSHKRVSSRRAVLKGACGVAVSLPWLESLESLNVAHANPEGLAKNFVAIYVPGGTVRDHWNAEGSGDNMTLSEILSPLESVKQHIVVPKRVSLQSANGE